MPETALRPLARFVGKPPPAPAWYRDAVADAGESGAVTVDGVAVAWRAWGRRGDPGMLLVHGGWAHAGWWAHVAPRLAARRRVAALSLSGMGTSGWRPYYSIAGYARELRAVALATGLDAAGPPVLVGHSFGCAPTLAALADPDRWAGRGILLDGSITMRPGQSPLRPARPGRCYPTVAAALARFRLVSDQPCPHPFILDGIARGSLARQAEGYRWSFDPALYDRCTLIDTRATLKGLAVSVGFIRGERSAIVPPDILAGLRADRPDMPVATIAQAGHHLMLDRPLALVAAIETLLAG